MGRGGLGVQAHGKRLRVEFTWREQRCRETLDLADTPANRKSAANFVAVIKREIATGVFDYGRHFPQSSRAAAVPVVGGMTFGAMARKWLKTMAAGEAATRAQYASHVRQWIRLLGDDTPIASINLSDLKTTIAETPWASPKALNNILVALRGVFALAAGDKVCDDIAAGIKGRKIGKPKPNPFTRAQAAAIVADLYMNCDAQVARYFEWQFLTGMRPEETIALWWSDIDRAAATIHVQRVRTCGGRERDGTKTGPPRFVDLVPRAIALLREQKACTFLKGQRADIFENPKKGKPWHSERQQRETYWYPCLKRLGIPARHPYQTRHTVATAAIMAGVPPIHIAAQLGHSVEQLFRTYTKRRGTTAAPPRG